MNLFSKIISLSFLISIFFSPNYSYAQAGAQLSATVSGTVITATLTGIAPENTEKINIFAIKDTFPIGTPYCSVEPCSPPQPTKEVAGTTIKWTIKNGITGGSVYEIRAEGKNGYAFISNVVTVPTGLDTIDAKWPLNSQQDGTNAYISGKINNTNISDFSAKLEYSVSPLKPDESTPADIYGPINAQKTQTPTSEPGINADGTYFYKLTNLTASQTYSIRQTITSKSGSKEIKVGSFNAKTGIIPDTTTTQAKSDAERSYRLLAPLPGLDVVLDYDLCKEYVAQGKSVPGGSCDNQISYFINLLIKIMIGLSAVFLVVQLIIQGYEYMVTDTPFKKTAAKSRFFDAFFGLLLAMSAYLILNTINPNLVSSDLSIDSVNLSVINDFDVTGAYTGSFDMKPVKVNFNKEAYPAAKLASDKTGVPTSFILAIFAQETGSGTNLGTCLWSAPKVMREDNVRKDKTAFTTIMTELGLSRESKSVSCPFGSGWGGGMGYTQFIPTTWLEQRIDSKNYLGHMPSPWNLQDAIMTSAVYLKKLGAISDPRNAACKYYSGSKCDPNRTPANAFYGDQVMGKMASLEKQIAASIAKGEIK